MSEFGSTLFRGSRVLFWGIVPVAFLAAVILPISVVQWTFRTTFVTVCLECALILLVLGDQVNVRLVTPPVTHTGPLERLHTKSLDELEDWQVTLPDGKVRGGFTMRVMRRVR
jgi:hypothetical protein